MILEDYIITFRVKASDSKGALSLANLMLKGMMYTELVGIHKEQAPQDTVVVYTDGGCDVRKNGIGAWAYVITPIDRTQPKIVECHSEENTTNNRMELTAVIQALKAIEPGPPVLVVSDSEYVIKGITVWILNWLKNGWKSYGGKDVINKDLWLELKTLYEAHNVQFKHVRGHSGDPDNEHCDKLCKDAIYARHRQMLKELEF
jgi:ribonuclease HI